MQKAPAGQFVLDVIRVADNIVSADDENYFLLTTLA